MNYTETLAYLYASQPVFHLQGGAAYKPGLDNTLKLLSLVGNPHEKFRTIHVAGTNGKGSTSHLLAAVLQSAGYKTGLYTSPHLVDFGERIRIDGEMVNRDFVIGFVEKNKTILEAISPSFFETTMCMAFSYFAEQKVDIAIIEVGLGGRLDSTNIITPELSIITNIGIDHTEFLGTTLPEIASEKAGIIKQNIPVIIGETHHETCDVFRKIATEKNASITFADQCEVNSIPDSDLKGSYQEKNKQTTYVAILKLQELGFKISENDISKGFAHSCQLTGFQGRWQLVSEHPKVICDTGHNAHGMRLSIKQLCALSCEKLHIVIGFVSDKDIDEILAMLPQNAFYYFTKANTPRALSETALHEKALSFGLTGGGYATTKDAFRCATKNAHANDVIFVGGSNFVVGEVLQITN